METRTVPTLLAQLHTDDAANCLVTKSPAVGVSATFAAAVEQASSITPNHYRADSARAGDPRSGVQLGINREEAGLLWAAGARREELQKVEGPRLSQAPLPSGRRSRTGGFGASQSATPTPPGADALRRQPGRSLTVWGKRGSRASVGKLLFGGDG